MQEHGPWTILRKQTVYQDAWVQVQLDDVIRPDTLPGTYTTVTLKAGVCVIAVDARQRVHLTKEFHYAVGRTTLEGVSGGVEEGESPEATAQRELAEELGLTAKRWTRLGQVDPFTAAIHSPVQLYLAQDLSQGSSQPEGTETIEHVILSLDEAVRMVLRSEITHGPTCVALLRIALGKDIF